MPTLDWLSPDQEDGGEAWRCALAIDAHPQVRRWVRNLDSDPVAGFRLPTSFGRSYPDVVCALMDATLGRGRLRRRQPWRQA